VLIMADRATAKGLETVIEMAPDTPLFIVSDANHCTGGEAPQGACYGTPAVYRCLQGGELQGLCSRLWAHPVGALPPCAVHWVSNMPGPVPAFSPVPEPASGRPLGAPGATPLHHSPLSCGARVQVMINLLSAAIMETSKGYVRRAPWAPRWCSRTRTTRTPPTRGAESERRSVSISEDGSEDVLFGDGNHLHRAPAAPRGHCRRDPDVAGRALRPRTPSPSRPRARYSTVLYLALYCAVLCCAVMCCTVLYSEYSVLYCTVLLFVWYFCCPLSRCEPGVALMWAQGRPSIKDHCREYRH